MLEILGIILFVAFTIFINIFFKVDHQKVAIVERFGKFKKVATSGLNFKIPFVDQVAGNINLRILQLNVVIETKTLDDVFIGIVSSVQYRALPNKVYEAFYTLEDHEAQIQSFVFDVIRAQVPKINLDDVFSKKDDIANHVKKELKEIMNEFGYDIINTLITDIHPDAKVKKAMNEINEAQRLRIAATERGEAEKILKIKQAEAESESKVLQGKGIAGQRHEIMNGLKESLNDFQKQIGDNNPHDAMTLIMMAQYFDTIKELSQHSKQNTILIPHSPGGMQDLFSQIRNSIITANKVCETDNK